MNIIKRLIAKKEALKWTKNKLKAFVCINNKMYYAEIHEDCLMEFVKEKDEKLYSQMKDVQQYWTNSELMRKLDILESDNYPIIFGVVAAIDDIEVLTIMDPFGCSKKEGAQILKRVCPNYDIYDDESQFGTPVKIANLSCKNYKQSIKLAQYQYNVHDIANRLYRTVPLVPIGDLMQNIAQDIQTGLYDGCGDPNTNWEAWKDRCTDILSERGIVNVMGPRGFIDGNPIVSQDCKYIRQARLKKITDKE